MIRIFYTRVQPPCEILISFFFFWPHHVACGILVPQPRIKPVLPAVEVQSANHLDLQGIPLISILGIYDCDTLALRLTIIIQS